ncbi:hypothetical protein SNEBB_004032 [Seison nebaliae]|nr:hypothetical protein SNEBB_004032 [Seison nebaliae]
MSEEKKLENVDHHFDDELLEELWNGTVTIRIELDESSVFLSSESPDPVYISVHRNTYFPIIMRKFDRYFTSFLDPMRNDSIWFEFQDEPLRWQLPIGLLYDLHTVHISPKPVPWVIRAKYGKFPFEQILQMSNDDLLPLENYFMSTLKEADELKHHGEILQTMTAQQHKQLWTSLSTNNFKQFWEINRLLMRKNKLTNCFHNIPFRYYYRKKNEKMNNFNFYQALFSPIDGEGNKRRFRDLLEWILEKFEMKENVQQIISEGQFIVQGIVPSFNVPIQYMCEHLSSPDNFLHIIAIY